MKRILTILCLTGVSILTLGDLKAQLFKNNNTSCEDIQVVGRWDSGFNAAFVSHSIDCGNFDGNNQIDCFTQQDSASSAVLGEQTNSLLLNTGNQTNSCANLGGNSQFEPAVNYVNLTALSADQTVPIRMGTVRAGQLDLENFDDVAFTYVFEFFASPASRAAESFLSDANGGFSPIMFTPLNGLLAMDIPLTENRPLAFPLDVFFNVPDISNLGSEPSLELLDCDGDGVEEAILPVRIPGEISDELGMMIVPNDGSGLTDSTVANDFISFSTDVGPSEQVGVTLTKGFYNADGFTDFVFAINREVGSLDALLLCLGTDLSCGFDCQVLNQIDLDDAYPTSIASGDFNGDFFDDIVVAQADLQNLLYVFQEEGAPFNSWPTTTVSVATLPNQFGHPLVVTRGRFSFFAASNAVDEVAASVPRFENEDDYFFGNQVASTVEVFTANVDGTINAPVVLSFAPQNSISASGLFAGDMDSCGGDDIIALANTREDNMGVTTVIRRASVFLNDNQNEAPVIVVPNEVQGQANIVLTIPATCEDPTLDNITYNWEVMVQPQGATTELVPENGFLIFPMNNTSTNFLTDTGGSYTLALTCSDACGESTSALVIVTIDGGQDDTTTTDSGTATTTGTDTESATTTGPDLLTQGSCIASLNDRSSNPNFFICFVVSLFVLLNSLIRLKKKRSF